MSDPDYCEGYYPKSFIGDEDRKAAARILREAEPPEPCDGDDPLQDWWLLLGLYPIERAAQVAVEGYDGGAMSWDEIYELLAALIEPEPRSITRRICANPRAIHKRYPCDICRTSIGDKRWRYCPNCGAEIKEDLYD